MLLYYISDRRQFPGGGAEQSRRLLARIAEAARAGVDLVQLREKDLPTRQLEHIARHAVRAVRENSSTTRLLINSRVDLALACGADGVHLTSADISAADARATAEAVRARRAAVHRSDDRDAAHRAFVVGVSTHSIAEANLAYSHGADLVVFGPVFEKISAPVRTAGVDELRRLCAGLALKQQTTDKNRAFEVFALGGVTMDNARECAAAGAAGIAGIRLFQENSVAEVVKRLRDL